MTVLTKEHVKSCFRDGKWTAPVEVDEDWRDSSEFASIDLEAAKALAGHKGDLNLNGLTELNEGVAKALAKNKGDLNLDGLTELSDEAVASLSKVKGTLSLGGLTELSDKAVASLSKVKGGLWLSSLAELSAEAARALAGHKGVLGLYYLTELSDEAARALAGHKGDLCLSGLTELSDETILSLSKVKGGLDLSGLTELSDKAAVSLSKVKGDLNLDGLTELSDEAVASLSKVKGTLSLGGLTELSDKAAASLSKVKGGLWLSSLADLSNEAAVSLSKVKGDLDLSGLTELSDIAASSLSKHEGCLYLYGLTESSDEVATALADHKGRINDQVPRDFINQMTVLPKKLPMSGSQHDITIFLKDVEIITDIKEGIEASLSVSKDIRNVNYNSECIYDELGYKRLLSAYGKALKSIDGGFKNIKSKLDAENNVASVSFKYSGEKFEGSWHQEGDFIEDAFVKIIKKAVSHTKKRVTLVNIPLCSQWICDIVFVDDPASAKKIKRLINKALKESEYPCIMEEEPNAPMSDFNILTDGPLEPIEPTGRPFAGPVTTKNIGEKVQVKWDESWWLGQIIAVFPENDTVEIHYIGWSAEWNEVVKLNRIRKHP